MKQGYKKLCLSIYDYETYYKISKSVMENNWQQKFQSIRYEIDVKHQLYPGLYIWVLEGLVFFLNRAGF